MPTGLRVATWSLRLMLLAGLLVVALGLLVLTGWHGRMLPWLRLRASWPPLCYNTALCFTLCGVGFLAVIGRWWRLARAAGGIVAVVTLTTLSQYAFSIDLGLDQALMADYVRVGMETPGRMAVTTAVGFAFCSAAILLMSVGPPTSLAASSRTATVGLLGVLAATIGFATVGLYVLDVMAPYGWGRISSEMAMHAALGFVVLGSGVALWSWLENHKTSTGVLHWLPVLVGAVTATTTLLVWQALLVQSHRALEDTVRAVTQQVKNEISARMDARLKALTQLGGARLGRNGPPQQQLWETEVTAYSQDFPGFQAINWADAALRLRWVAPLHGNEAALGIQIDALPAREAIQAARAQRTVRLSSISELRQGGAGFVAYAPVFTGDVFQGLVCGVFQVRTLFDTILADIAPGYELRLFEGGKEFYARPLDHTPFARRGIQELALTLPGVTWRVQVWPGPTIVTQGQSALPMVVLTLGLAIAVMLTATTALAQTARRRARDVEVINRQLAAERAQLEAMLQQLPVGVIIAEPERASIILANEEARRIWRYETLPSHGYDDFVNYQGFHPDGRRYRVEEWPLARALHFGETVTEEEMHFVRGDGSRGVMLCSAAPVCGAHGGIVAGVMVFTDITARRQAESLIRLQRQLLDLANDCIFLWDQQDRVTYWNQGAERLYGWTAAEVIGQNAHAVLQTVFPEPVDTIKEQLTREGHWEGQLRHRTKDGRWIVTNSRWTLQDDPAGQSVATMEINQDITTQVQAEAALRALNLELEQRVRTRTAELQRANNDLRQMAYVAAHDLQEPARMVTIYLQKITRCLPDRQDPDLLEALCYAVEGGRRMTAQLNDLLKYLEIEERGDEQSLADCEHVLRQTLAILQPLADACGAVVTHEPLPTIAANAVQLQEVFRQLLDNAFKFCEGAPPRVHV